MNSNVEKTTVATVNSIPAERVQETVDSVLKTGAETADTTSKENKVVTPVSTPVEATAKSSVKAAADATAYDMVPQLQAQLAELAGTVAGQAEIILSLKGQQAQTLLDGKPAKLEIPTKLVKRKNKSYKWAVASFTLGDHRGITAEEAALDPDIIDEILAMPGQGLLVEQA